MSKRGQVTIFFIIGFAILIAFGFIFLIKTNITEGVLGGETEESQMLLSEKASLKTYVEQCLEETLNNGKQSVGLDEEMLEDYINNNLDKCVDLSSYESRGLKVSEEVVKTNVIVNEGLIIADVNYSITLTKGDSLVEVSKFSFSIQRSTSTLVPTDSNGVVQGDVVLFSSDKLVEIDIPAGTQITDANGAPVQNPDLLILIKALESPDNTIYGYEIYGLEPAGLQFSNDITVKIRYDDAGMGEHEVNLVIVKREDSNHIWKTVPSTDYPAEDTVISTIDSFSEVGISITCGDPEVNNKIYFDTEFIYLVACEPCNCFTQSDNGIIYFDDIDQKCSETGEDPNLRCGINVQEDGVSLKIKKFDAFERYNDNKFKGGTTGYIPYSELSNFDTIRDNYCAAYYDETDEDTEDCKNDWDDRIKTLSGCNEYDWDGDGSNEKGYPSLEAAGGYGEFNFEVEDPGNCIDEVKINNLFVDDRILEFKLNGVDLIEIDEDGLTPQELQTEFNEISGQIKNKLVSGNNILTVKMGNTYGACSFSRLLFEYSGTELTCNEKEGFGKCCDLQGEVEPEEAAGLCGFPVYIESEELERSTAAGVDVEEGSEVCGPSVTGVGGCNKFGFFTLTDEDIEYVAKFSGPGGWIARAFGATGAMWGNNANTAPGVAPSFVEQAWANGLNPVIRVLDSNPTAEDIDNLAGSQATNYVNFIENLVSDLTLPEGRKLFVQIGNEPNIHGLSAADYANMIIGIDSQLSTTTRKKVNIVTAGISPNFGEGLNYVNDLYDVEGFYDAFDVWCSHPYPSYGSGASPFYYDQEIANSDNFNKPILLTEAGQGERCEITDQENTDGAINAFNEWNSDGRVMGVTIFTLLDTYTPERACTSWIGANRADESQWRPQYVAIKVDGPRRGEISPAQCDFSVDAIVS
ncbi:hypothetical protein A3K72_03600 [Candidatus Woesearchaeota archaeon RBG_13_36_6]|nr:MAG: hypothetical protein A3K72_03600 [Candidatus Woesearchaeota archaeon RBG_13_36_6]